MRKLNMFYEQLKKKFYFVLYIIKLILILNLAKSCFYIYGYKKKYIYFFNEEIYKRFFRDNLF